MLAVQEYSHALCLAQKFFIESHSLFDYHAGLGESQDL